MEVNLLLSLGALLMGPWEPPTQQPRDEFHGSFDIYMPIVHSFLPTTKVLKIRQI